MDRDELEGTIHTILNPEPEDLPEHQMFAPSSLRKKYPDLDFSFLDPFFYEGSSVHKDTRICHSADTALCKLQRNLFVPESLFSAALRTFGDSIIAYHDVKERQGQLRFYPQVLLTFWSGFETFVRAHAELFLVASVGVPSEVRYFLREEDVEFDAQGQVVTRTRFRPTLERYRILLQYGYGFTIGKGDKYWQNLQAAQKLRDYYTHLDLDEARSITAQQVLDFMEAVLMSIIYPSAKLKRTLMLGVYFAYSIWTELAKLVTPYAEQPLLKNMDFQSAFGFHCNFDNIDSSRFPSSDDYIRRGPSTPPA